MNDHSLRHHHKKLYHRYGRWILAAAVLIGWGVSATTAISELVTAAAIAFLSGGILLSAFKEELPEERESRFSAFAIGAFVYAIILIAA